MAFFCVRMRKFWGTPVLQILLLGERTDACISWLSYFTETACRQPLTRSLQVLKNGFKKKPVSAIRPALVKPPEHMPENLTRHLAWVGGAILAKVVFPQNQHVTKADYKEYGPSVVHQKCF